MALSASISARHEIFSTVSCCLYLAKRGLVFRNVFRWMGRRTVDIQSVFRPDFQLKTNFESPEHITPVLDRLSVLHNFTLESQVQFHAPLAFNTHLYESNGFLEHGLSQEDLTVFINSAEWTLCEFVWVDS